MPQKVERKAHVRDEGDSHSSGGVSPLKVSLVRLSDELKKETLEALIVGGIHDLIWVGAAADEESEVWKLIEKVMTMAGKLIVPLEADSFWGWLD